MSGQTSTHKNSRLKAWLIRGTLPVTLLVLWYLACTEWKIHPLILPHPFSVLEEFWNYAISGELWMHMAVSLWRCLLGFVLGSLAGIVMGVLLGWYSLLDEFFDLVVNFMRAIPKTALAPLFIVWFGFGDLPKILLIGLASFFYTLIPTIEGVKNIDNLLVKSARSLGAKDGQLLTTVVMPSALPSMYAGLRLAAATSLVVLVFVEIIAGDSGLGFLLEQGRASLNMAVMYMTLFVLGVIGFVLDWLVRISETKLMPWRKGKTISY